MSANNLDRLAARTAQEIVQNLTAEDAGKLENLATKVLGVLQENGVYAGMLFLYSRSAREKAYAENIREALIKTLAQQELSALHLSLPADKDQSNWLEVSDHLNTAVCDELDTLLLIKQLWEQTLIYTRYSAKARG